ncbi:triosephosphate isomerase, partial [Kipferlia bialata]|eukprot:g11743.t1
MARTPVLGGNWKCNGTKASVEKLVSVFNAGAFPAADMDIVIAPPAIHIGMVEASLTKRVELATQNCYVKPSGAYTGELSVPMIKDYGLNWVVLGHSERRNLPSIKESNEFVAEKTLVAIEGGLKVMLCCGESLEQRESGATEAVVAEQLAAVAAVLSE